MVKYGDISHWDVSNVTDMSSLFENAGTKRTTSFNQPLNNWNVSKVGSDGFEKALIGTRGARETFLRGRKGRAAKNSVLTSGVKQLKC